MSIASVAIAAHLETTQPHIPQRQPTQTEQFVDAPPPEKYPSRWRRDCADNPDALYVMNPTAVRITNQIREKFNCETERNHERNRY